MPNVPMKKPMVPPGRAVKRGPVAPTPGTPVKRGPMAPAPAAPAAPVRPFKKGGFVPFGKGAMPMKKGKKGC